MEKSGDSDGFGCGSLSTAQIMIHVTTTTGGSFSLSVDNTVSVENLKKIIAKKLKVSKDRICLLHRERELHDGSLTENGLFDGSKLILTPNVETGLLAQRAENTVMQALESLNDNQVNDFLSGKSPLNLSVRLGDHMMLIQLQLSTLNPTSSSSSSSSSNTSSTPRIRSSSSRSRSSFPPTTASSSSSSRHHRSTGSSLRRHNSDSLCSSAPCSPKILAGNDDDSSDSASCLSSQEIDNIHSIVKSLSNDDDKIPIRSLSNLVSDPISANLTSCLCKRLDTTENSNSNANECHNLPSTSTQSNLHKTAHNPISKHKSKVQSLNNSKKTINFESETSTTAPPTDVAGTSENPALAEASRNLTQTLRKLSKRVFTNKISSISAEETNRNVTSGAVIESMKHHGKGIYSGTFSGTLNPALQDKFGRPKRDISTIIHILNDLLSAAPQCARTGTKIYFEPTTTAGGSTTTTATSSSPLRTSIAGTSSRTSAMMAKHISTVKRHLSSSSSPSSVLSMDECACSGGGVEQSVIDAIEMENSKTKNKLDHLRLIMQQKKERREARKMKTLPYTTTNMNRPINSESIETTVHASNPAQSAQTATNIVSASSSAIPIPDATSNSHQIVEEVDTVA